MINKNDFGYFLNLKVIKNESGVELSEASEVDFLARSNNRDREVTGLAVYDAEHEVYKYLVKKDDFIAKEVFSVFLIFKFFDGEELVKRVTARFGVLKVE